MAAGESELRKVLAGLLERWDAAAKVARQSGTGDLNVPTAEARDALWALEAELVDFFFVQLHGVLKSESAAARLRERLMQLLAPDIGELMAECLNERKRRQHGKR